MYGRKLQRIHMENCLQDITGQKAREGNCFLQQKLLRGTNRKNLLSVHHSTHSLLVSFKDTVYLLWL
jgi:hypothetical protein